MERIPRIKKADGTEEPFDITKLQHSLHRAGASQDVTSDIAQKMEAIIIDGMTTEQIYRGAFALLRKKEKASATGGQAVAAKYSLKRAVFNLGPSGFPFEDFIAALYQAKGFSTMTGIMVHGRCAEHEIDLLARSPEKTFVAEIKFHNHLGIKTDLKIALYVHARFVDLIKGVEEGKTNYPIEEGVLITNTKFTENAIVYSECNHVKMIGWDYPREGNLYELIGETGLHPITCITTLSGRDKRSLLENKIVLCKTVKDNPSLLEQNGVAPAKVPEILTEISALCRRGAGV